MMKTLTDYAIDFAFCILVLEIATNAYQHELNEIRNEILRFSIVFIPSTKYVHAL